MNRRLLVVSFHAPPEPAVGGLRWAGLSRYLAEEGWAVRVLTQSARAGDVAETRGVEVESIPRRTLLQDHYRRWRRARLASPGDGSEGASADGAKGAEPVTSSSRARTPQSYGTLRSNLAALLSFPDHGRGWVLRAARATRRVIREWQPDVVVSTGPPHSVHLATRLGLLGSDLPWVADFRDPWVTPWRDRLEAGWSLAVSRCLEADLFRRAGLVLATTPELQGVLADTYPTANVAWLPNGVDASVLPKRSESVKGRLRLTHLGSVYFNRDPTPVLRAFASFLACQPEAAEGSALRFVGHISADFRPGMERTVRELGLESTVELIDPMPREQALELLADSEMALVLAQGQDGMIPAKLYECVAMGMPTLVVAEPESSSGRESRRLGAAVHRPDDEAGMVGALTRAWSGDWASEWTPPARVDHANLAQELDRLLRDLTDASSAEGGSRAMAGLR